MTTFKISRGKFTGLNACCDSRGVVAALAIDHRENLLQAIAKARGEHGTASAEDMQAFKTTVTQVLTPHASAILLDPVYGLSALAQRAPGTGVMLAYEMSGYDGTTPGRLPDLLPEWSVRRLVEVGAQAIKILLFYNPTMVVSTPSSKPISSALALNAQRWMYHFFWSHWSTMRPLEMKEDRHSPAKGHTTSHLR